MARMTDYQELFNKAGGYYASNRDEIFPFIPGSVKKTLEFGCGQGDFSSLLKERFQAQAWAVEIHKPSAEIAAAKLDRVICRDADEAMQELPNNYFDGIFFLDLLEHLVNPYELLSKCREKLSPDGVIIASIPNIRYYRAFTQYVFGGKWEYQNHGIMDITHLRFFTYKSIKSMFENLGYTILTLQGIHLTSSKTFFWLNLLSLNRLWDVRFKHFIVVARKNI
jgi:2-polyprenyl-3-methyl-5-hydroxy-6-metoxy-1,4-benzoquinol methylase